MRSDRVSRMSFAITTMGRWQVGFRCRDWGPASIVAADLMCQERRQGTDRHCQAWCLAIGIFVVADGESASILK